MNLREIIRSGRVAEVGVDFFAVYVVLRDAAWRSPYKGRSELREAWQRGEIAAAVKQKKVAELLGCCSKTVSRAVVELEKKGWVKVRRPSGRVPVIVLGEVVEGEELFFADRGTLDKNSTPSPDSQSTDPGLLRGGDPEVLIEKKELETVTGDREGRRPIRRAKILPPRMIDEVEERPSVPTRTGWAALEVPPQKPPRPRKPVVDSSSGRKVYPDEFAALRAAREKKTKGDTNYSGEEMVAVWKHRYFRAFALEDLALETAAARRRAAVTFVQRTVDWKVSAPTLVAYLNDMLNMWASKKPGDRSPPGEVPRLMSLLKKDRDGPSWFWEQWRAGRSKRRAGR